MIGHVCAHRLLCYADDDEEFEAGALEEVRPDETTTRDMVHYNMMQAGHRSRSLRVVGLLQQKEVSILIDTGSDRDFLHPTIAE